MFYNLLIWPLVEQLQLKKQHKATVKCMAEVWPSLLEICTKMCTLFLQFPVWPSAEQYVVNKPAASNDQELWCSLSLSTEVKHRAENVSVCVTTTHEQQLRGNVHDFKERWKHKIWSPKKEEGWNRQWWDETKKQRDTDITFMKLHLTEVDKRKNIGKNTGNKDKKSFNQRNV